MDVNLLVWQRMRQYKGTRLHHIAQVQIPWDEAVVVRLDLLCFFLRSSWLKCYIWSTFSKHMFAFAENVAYGGFRGCLVPLSHVRLRRSIGGETLRGTCCGLLRCGCRSFCRNQAAARLHLRGEPQVRFGEGLRGTKHPLNLQMHTPFIEVTTFNLGFLWWFSTTLIQH